MSLSNTTVRAIYSGDNANRTFAIPFDPIVDDSAETVVYLRDDSDPDNPSTVLQVEGIGNDYTLTGAPDINSFHTNVYFNAGNIPTSDQVVIVERAVPKTQTLDLNPSGAFQPETFETSIDKIVAMVQELYEKLKRAPKLGPTSSVVDSTATDLELPEPIADTYLSWNTAGTALENKPATALSGAGNVVGPASATDTAVAVYSGTSGELIKNSSATISGTTLSIPTVSATDVNATGSVAATGIVTGNSFELGRVNLRQIVNAQTITVSNQFVVCDTSGGAYAATLPSVDSTHDGLEITFKKSTDDNNAVTVTAADSDTIDDGVATTYVVRANGEKLTLVYDDGNTNWVVKNSGTGTSLINTTIITADGTYTKNYAASYVKITAIGGGGGAGGVNGSGAGDWAASGGGGGAGGAIAWVDNSDIGATETATIGGGGSGGGGSNNGTAGGATSLGAHAAAGGGSGSAGEVAGPTVILNGGANGGSGTIGDILVTGEVGKPGLGLGASTSNCISGTGGCAAILGGGNGRAVGGDNHGYDATSYGGGGGGASVNNVTSNYSGGDGADGVIIVEEYG